MEKDDEVHNTSGTSYDFGARMYSSRLGRWNSVDPLAHDARQVDKSPYASMWNNPILYKDPDGKIPIPVITGIIGGLVGGAVEFGSQVASNKAQGHSYREALRKVDLFDVVVSAAEGAALGSGMGVMGKTLLTPTTALLKSSVDYLDGEFRYIGGTEENNKEKDKFAIDLASNMAAGTVGKFGLSDAVSKKVIRGLS
jgi:RHS repeat-associated protein